MRAREVFVRFLSLLPCVLFIFSILAPILEATFSPLFQIPERTVIWETFWSFKKRFLLLRFGMDLKEGEVWFFDYWSEFPALAFLFTLQLITVFCALLAALRSKPRILLYSCISSASASVLQWLFSLTFSSEWHLEPSGSFWISLLSTVLFISVYVTWQFLSKPKSSITNHSVNHR